MTRVLTSLPIRLASIFVLGVLTAMIAALVGSADPAQSAVSCTRYASPAGSDGGDGSGSSPYRTVQKLVSSLGPSATGCLLGGTYNENVTISSGGASETSRVTLRTAPGYDMATVKGSIYVTSAAPFVTIQGLRIDGSGYPNITVQLFGDFSLVQGNDITNRHLGESCVIVGEYEGSWARAVSGAVIDSNRIHDCGSPAHGAHDHGIYLASSRDAKVTNNYIFDNGGGWGIQIWADAHRSEIAHNVVDGNTNGNIIIAGGNFSVLGPSSNNTIHDNILSFPLSRYNVEPYWSGGILGIGNAFVANCVYGGPSGNWGELGNGYVQIGSIVENPLYTDRAAKDFTLRTGSPCAGKGPVSAGGVPAGTVTTTTTVTTTAATTTTTTATTAPVTTPASPTGIGAGVTATATTTATGATTPPVAEIAPPKPAPKAEAPKTAPPKTAPRKTVPPKTAQPKTGKPATASTPKQAPPKKTARKTAAAKKAAALALRKAKAEKAAGGTARATKAPLRIAQTEANRSQQRHPAGLQGAVVRRR